MYRWSVQIFVMTTKSWKLTYWEKFESPPFNSAESEWHLLCLRRGRFLGWVPMTTTTHSVAEDIIDMHGQKIYLSRLVEANSEMFCPDGWNVTIRIHSIDLHSPMRWLPGARKDDATGTATPMSLSNEQNQTSPGILGRLNTPTMMSWVLVLFRGHIR